MSAATSPNQMNAPDPAMHANADDRYEVASRAAMNERRAKPVHLVIFGLILFTIASAFLLYSWRSAAKAERKLERVHVAAVNNERLITQINELTAASVTDTVDPRYAKISDIRTRIKGIGVQVGLENEINLPTNTTPRTSGSTTTHTYPYTLRDSSIERILQWIQSCQDQIPGLGVREMTINLNSKTWLVKVTLTRSIRAE